MGKRLWRELKGPGAYWKGLAIVMGIYGVLLPTPRSPIFEAGAYAGGYPTIFLIPVLFVGTLMFFQGAKPYLYYFIAVSAIFHTQLSWVKIVQLGGLNVQGYDFFTFFTTILLLKRISLLKIWRKNRIYGALRLFAIVCLFGIAYGVPQYGPRAIADARLMPLHILPAFLLLAVLAKDKLYFYGMVKWLFFVTMVCVGQIFLKVALGFSSQDSYAQGGLTVRFSDANTAIFLGLALVMLLYYSTFTARWPLSKQKVIISIALITIALMLGQVRTVWVSVALIFPLVFLFAGGKVRIGKSLVLLSSTVVLLVVTFLAIKWVSPRIYESILLSSDFLRMLRDPGNQTHSVAWRFLAWGQVWVEAIKRPVIGHGWGSQTEFLTMRGVFELMPVHNGYLELFYKQGVLGLMFFIMLNLKVLYHLLRTRTIEHKWLTMGLFLAAATHMVFNFGFGSSYWYFILVALAIYVTSYIPSHEQAVISHAKAS